VSEHHSVLALESSKQLARCDGSRPLRVCPIGRSKSVEWFCLLGEEHIAVTTHAGVDGPLVPRHRDHLARRVVFGSEPVDLGPKSIVDLKIVGLVVEDGTMQLASRADVCEEHWPRKNLLGRQPTGESGIAFKTITYMSQPEKLSLGISRRFTQCPYPVRKATLTDLARVAVPFDRDMLVGCDWAILPFRILLGIARQHRS
jgi:hypothetical protein